MIVLLAYKDVEFGGQVKCRIVITKPMMITNILKQLFEFWIFLHVPDNASLNPYHTRAAGGEVTLNWFA